MKERRYAAIFINAVAGDVRGARGIVGRAIRSALGVRRWGEDPHYVHYFSEAELLRDGAAPWLATPRFTLDVTDAEMAAVTTAIERLSAEDGWNRPPVDIYHD